MIDLVTGPPGSGKSYFMVKKIYDELIRKEKKYKRIYTNINGFNYKKANELAGFDYIKPLDFDDLRKHMIDEFNYHEKQKKKILDTGDKDYDTYLKDNGVFSPYIDSLLVIDEVHLFFTDDADKVSLRFITYHRHFGIDLLMATQNKNLIDKKYLVCIETLYKALPSHKRFFSHVFRYKVFAGYQEYKSNLVKTISLKLDKNVVSLYNSGSSKINKSALSTFLIPILILALVSYFLFSFLVKGKTHNSDTNSSNSVINESVSTINSQPDVVSDSTFIKVRCYPDSCRINDLDHSFYLSSLLPVLHKHSCKPIYREYVGVNFSLQVLQCDQTIEKFIKIFDKGVPNEKSSNFVPSSILK